MEKSPSNNMQNKSIDDDEINLNSIIKFFKRGRFFIFGLVITSTLFSTLFAFKAKPKWSGSFNIVVKKESSNADSGNTFGSYSSIFRTFKTNDENETQRLILMSPSVLMPVFEYVKSYYDEKNINTEELFFKEWVEDNLEINFENKTSVLKVEYINEDKKLIKNTLELISKKYKDYSKRDTEKQLNKTIEYLIQQIDLMKDKSLNSTREFNEFSIKNGLGNLDGFVGLGNSTSLGRYNSIFEQNFNQENNTNNISQNNKILQRNNPATRYQNQFRLLEDYESSFVDLSSKLKPNSSTLKEIKEKIENLRSSLIRPNEILIEYRRLNIEAARDESILQELENSLQVLQLNKIKSPDPWELISIPTIDNKPVYPQKKRIVIISFLLSLTLSSILFHIKEKFAGKIYELEEYKKYINYNFMDTIYKNNKKINKNIIGNYIDLKAKTALIYLHDDYFLESSNSDIEELIDIKNIELIDFKSLEDLSKYENIILITEEGIVNKENLNLIDKNILPFKKAILGWFYLV